MGCRCGTCRANQQSMSLWLDDGAGGWRTVFPLICFGIAGSLAVHLSDTKALDTVNARVAVPDGPGAVPRIRLEETGLQLAEDRSELAGRQKPGPERTGRVLADWRKGAQCGPDFCRHVIELPTDLVLDDLRPVGSRQAGGPNGVRGGAEPRARPYGTQLRLDLRLGRPRVLPEISRRRQTHLRRTDDGSRRRCSALLGRKPELGRWQHERDRRPEPRPQTIRGPARRNRRPMPRRDAGRLR